MARGLFSQSPRAKRHPKKISVTRPNFRMLPLSVEIKLTPPVPLLIPRRLFFLEQHKIFYDQHIHLGPHKTSVGIFRGTNDRLAYVAWLKIAHLLSRIITTLILTLAYYLVITPSALIKRVFGGLPLPLKPDKDASSYWVNRTEGAQPKERFIKRY